MIIQELFSSIGLEIEESSFAVAEHLLEITKHGLEGLAAAAGAAMLSIGIMVKKTGDAGLEAKQMAERTGMTTQEFQALKFSALEVGDQVPAAMTKLARSVYEARYEGGAAGMAFRMMGISLFDANGHAKGTRDMLLSVSDAVRKMPAGMERAAQVTALLGRGSAALIPWLAKGREGIHELELEADRLGIVMSSDTIAASMEYKESLHQMESAIKGFGITVGSIVMPYVTRFLKATTEFIVRSIPAVKSFMALVTSSKMLGWAFLGVASAALFMMRTSLVAFGSMMLSIVPEVMSLIFWLQALGAAGIWAGLKIAAGAIIAKAALLGELALALAFIIGLVAVFQDLWYSHTGGESLLEESFGPASLSRAITLANRFFAAVGDLVKSALVALFGQRTVDESIEGWKIALSALDRFGAWLKAKIKAMLPSGMFDELNAEFEVIDKLINKIPLLGGLQRRGRLAREQREAGIPDEQQVKYEPGVKEQERLDQGEKLPTDLSPDEAKRAYQRMLDRAREINGHPELVGKPSRGFEAPAEVAPQTLLTPVGEQPKNAAGKPTGARLENLDKVLGTTPISQKEPTLGPLSDYSLPVTPASEAAASPAVATEYKRDKYSPPDYLHGQDRVDAEKIADQLRASQAWTDARIAKEKGQATIDTLKATQNVGSRFGAGSSPVASAKAAAPIAPANVSSVGGTQTNTTHVEIAKIEVVVPSGNPDEIAQKLSPVLKAQIEDHLNNAVLAPAAEQVSR